MKRLLIVCDIFPPAFGPRMGYLCKYLPLYGWQPTVVAEDTADGYTAPFPSGYVPATLIRYYPRHPRWRRTLQWAFTLAADILFDYKNRRLYRTARRLARRQHFDAVLSSAFRTFPLGAAARLADELHIPFVADLRDILEQAPSGGSEYTQHRLALPPWARRPLIRRFRRLHLRRRNRALRAADALTTVSPWHVDTLRPYNPDVTLIYNGYDPELFQPLHRPNPCFYITYTGRLLSAAINNPDLLMQALSLLHRQGIFTPDTCRVRWYTDAASRPIIRAAAMREGVEAYMDYLDYVPAAHVPAIRHHSAVLLLLTNHTAESGANGIMTTKFFEYLAVGKPILCVRSDESCLAAALTEARAGLAARNADEATRFLYEQYDTWKNTGRTAVTPPADILLRYSRREQAGQFARLFDRLSSTSDRCAATS
jgi:glycosyltransferase involved in cell wall biosynthesis